MDIIKLYELKENKHEQIMSFTGGSIVLTVGMICLAAIALVISTVVLIVKLVKDESIGRSLKIEKIIFIISAVIISLFIGSQIGYNLGVLRML